MQATRADIYKTVTRSLLGGPRPVLIIDWSELKSDGRWHLLRAGFVAKGRTLTVYEEVHPEAKKHNRRVQTAFLRRLQQLLPAESRPILITDAGFRVPWFRAVETMGWHWVELKNGVREQLFLILANDYSLTRFFYGRIQLHRDY